LHNKTGGTDMFPLYVELTAGKLPPILAVGWYLFKTFVKENIFRIETPFSGVGHGA
ncbi:unnamed protein product, partial [Allacma fusca]